MKWRIYYGDGTTYEGDPFHAPGLNVQLIKQECGNERGFKLIHNKNHYVWSPFGDPGWHGVADDWGLMDYIAHSNGPQKILIGRVCPDKAYEEICRKAVEEPL